MSPVPQSMTPSTSGNDPRLQPSEVPITPTRVGNVLPSVPSTTSQETSSKSATAQETSKDALSDNPSAPTRPKRKYNPLPKTHECWTCYKCFDRRSTLRVHLLTHSKYQDHVCDKCGRRFSVASNLKRHSGKCKANSAPSSSSDSSGVNAVSPTPAESPSACTSSDTAEMPARPVRRRCPNISAPWIPPSLAAFNFGGLLRAVTLPSPPVCPSVLDGEERDSCKPRHEYPYHPVNWTGRLPGPALLPVSELVHDTHLQRRWITFN